MKRVILEKIGSLVIKDLPIPVITKSQVLVKMGLATICSLTDLHIVEGTHPAATALPSIIGHEAAGTIVAVGSDVTGYQPGDRVAYKGFMSGCFSEYSAVGLDDLFKIPDHVSFEAAAIMEIASCVYSLVRQCVKLGDHVLVIGQGCSGLFGTIFARLAGASMIAVTATSGYKRQLAKQYGAHIIIDPNAVDLKAKCDEITGGKGFDAVLEFVGKPETIAVTVKLVKRLGLIGIFGACSELVPFDFFALHGKGANIVTTGHEYAYSKVPYQKMLDFQLSGQINFAEFVSHRFPITEVQKGFDLIKKHDEQVLRIALLPTE